jgi:NADPH-dependent ferric siderophore reductase
MTFEQWISETDSRETSETLLRAIWRVAGGFPERAEHIWADGEADDIRKVRALVQEWGFEPDHLDWGAAGNQWHTYAD